METHKLTRASSEAVSDAPGIIHVVLVVVVGPLWGLSVGRQDELYIVTRALRWLTPSSKACFDSPRLARAHDASLNPNKLAVTIYGLAGRSSLSVLRATVIDRLSELHS